MEPIDQLTKNLGVSKAQAEGGVGLLFKQAKEKMSCADFSKLSVAILGVDKLIGAAPTSETPPILSGGDTRGGLGGLGELPSGVGGSGGASGGLGDLGSMLTGLGGGGSWLFGRPGGGFSKLGLNASMIAKFLPIILSFLQSNGGERLKGLLGNAFK